MPNIISSSKQKGICFLEYEGTILGVIFKKTEVESIQSEKKVGF